MRLKTWMIVTAILLVLLFWFALMSMFYKFIFMVIGITSAIFGTWLVVKIIAPAINWMNREKKVKKESKHEKKVSTEKTFVLDERIRRRIHHWVDS